MSETAQTCATTCWAAPSRAGRCMACVEACPVGIEHVPTIVQGRADVAGWLAKRRRR